jgi:adenylate kinase
MGVCTAEAFEEYGDKISEIDASELSVEEIVCLICDVICDKIEFPVGEVDFMDWIISNS